MKPQSDDFTEKLRDTVTQIEKKGVEYANARGISWHLQEMRKVVLADEMRMLDQNLSVAEQDKRARYSKAYVLHLEGTKVAIQRELTFRAKYERYKYQFEAIRSMMSLEKSKMDLL